jgi:3-oxoacyl-[acyl-carrier protein] reductase
MTTTDDVQSAGERATQHESGGYRLTGLGDKVAVVTGAGRMRSIGRGIAVELARAGCHVALTSTDPSPERYLAEEREANWRNVDSVADEIRQLGRNAMTVVTDVADPDQCELLVEAVLETYGRVDVLVNCAAAGRGGDHSPVVDMPIDAWRRVIDINLNGTFYMSRVFAQRLVAGGRGGSIINISSIAAKMMRATRGAYSASKVGINALTSSMAKELGKEGIRVNSICPGYIATGRMDSVSEAERLKLIEPIPLGRPGTPLDIATLAVFLASDQGSWITGQQWNVDGGQITVH